MLVIVTVDDPGPNFFGGTVTTVQAMMKRVQVVISFCADLSQTMFKGLSALRHSASPVYCIWHPQPDASLDGLSNIGDLCQSSDAEI